LEKEQKRKQANTGAAHPGMSNQPKEWAGLAGDVANHPVSLLADVGE
jgi:hypothetical protein